MKKLMIRAEDKNRWERRAPVVPVDLASMIRETGGQALVETSDKRFFTQEQYAEAGAASCQGMEDGDVILGVKEIPIEKLLDDKTYVFFSHTIKGQKDNMPLLKRIMDSGSTLIDYEKITDDQGRRLIYFGPYAGHAGAIDILSLMGEYWAAKGIDTPFAAVRRAHQYDSVEAAHKHLADIGRVIEKEGFPEPLCPFTIGILGYGNVSGGAQEIFDCLPVERIAADEINAFVSEGRGNRHTVYLTVFKEQDLVEPTATGAAFDLNEYFTHPERYKSRFERFLPSFTLLVNAVYWEKRYPRFVTWQGLKRLAEAGPEMKLAGIADITCDTNGSIECNVKSTSSDMPAYQADPIAGTVSDGHLGNGIVLLAVDNLPCELPNDSSTFFSNQLRPFLPALIKADYHASLETSGLPPELQRATIVYNGKLTERFSYLKEHLDG
ncbi:bifunctional lysine ketoglutarate reductase /saccharopine dehydrogenase family protein [uncultured Desulfosarcina sp.]|uniref:bifunctional lysine ketoglutarate reductase /saccharopine dehydrogenase family protein n=1 Tax=uncultured Desulfosarcina sp. TaxID=218289 RepID=UPI0029C8DE59|nr:bifunctional lysine ketoglutarate reductase /saccharopine dehydrogenase family protein [uncultured Desulfosarcina sp.]